MRACTRLFASRDECGFALSEERVASCCSCNLATTGKVYVVCKELLEFSVRGEPLRGSNMGSLL